jgi:hypothetical protein
MKQFSDLTEQEVLALAITNEQEASRIYRDFADGLKKEYPTSAKVFEEMADEELKHSTMILDLYRKKFGEHLPLIRRQDVKGFVEYKSPLWLTRPLGLEQVAKFVESMEFEAARYYKTAAESVKDQEIKNLLIKLAVAEEEHKDFAHNSESAVNTADLAHEQKVARRVFVLQFIQPGLAGLMDGSVSTLAPLFAAAFATHSTYQTFLVGLAASVGAGVSMGFAEALSDDGSLTGRGTPWIRGLICGLMTFLGGILHSLPYLINNFLYATIIAIAFVIFELGAISYIRYRFMDTPFLKATIQIVIGGAIVFIAGILIGIS